MRTWLPSPIYECLPYAYVIGGLLFMAGTIYTGPEVVGVVCYGGSGIISFVAGLVIFHIRRQRRMTDKSPSTQ